MLLIQKKNKKIITSTNYHVVIIRIEKSKTVIIVKLNYDEVPIIFKNIEQQDAENMYYFMSQGH